jgi:uncharacterized protein
LVDGTTARLQRWEHAVQCRAAGTDHRSGRVRQRELLRGLGCGAPTLSNNTAGVRADGGCTDTDDNAADFSTVSPPTPRNTASPLNPCGAVPPPNEPVVPACEDLTVARGQAGSVTLSASDADGTVVDASITSTPIDGITLENASPAPAVGGTFTVDLTAAATLGARDYSVDVTFANDDPTPQTASCTVTVRVMLELPADLCEVDPSEFTPIYEIQGPGAATPIEGERVVTRGVLTADFSSGAGVGTPNNQGLRGFFIEAIADDRDGDPLTSEGVFVFDGGGNAPGEVGDLIHVTGVVGEFNEVTQVSASRHQACDDTGVDTQLPPPAELPLPADPFDRAESFEPLESMRVTHPELTVVEFFQLERFGEVRLSSGGVLKNPTNAVDPYDDEAYEAIVLFNRANNIILDDGRTGQNLNRLPLGEVDPLPYVEPGDTLRIGDQLRDHTTILHFGFGEWRLQPVDIDAITQEFQDNRTRPRPESPPDVGGTMTVASFNVLNYFDGDGQGGGFPTARGAVTASELERQTAKLVDAIERIDADIVGLIEIENDGGEFQATQTLVDALNDAYGDEVYDFVDTGVIGTDAIKMAYIYKPANVQATGDYAILDSSVDPRFDDTRNRPVLAQTFTELRTNEAVTVAVNHLKSKGSNCGGAPDDDPRQGNCNGTRTAAAEAMADWLEGSPTGQDAKGSLIIGDLNAYAKEDPIRTLQEAGYTDLLDRFAPAGVMPYTYTFDATQGYLDHGLADEDVLPFVTGTAAWNINADEVPALDYQESVFLPGGSSASAPPRSRRRTTSRMPSGPPTTTRSWSAWSCGLADPTAACSPRRPGRRTRSATAARARPRVRRSVPGEPARCRTHAGPAPRARVDEAAGGNGARFPGREDSSKLSATGASNARCSPVAVPTWTERRRCAPLNRTDLPDGTRERLPACAADALEGRHLRPLGPRPGYRR